MESNCVCRGAQEESDFSIKTILFVFILHLCFYESANLHNLFHDQSCEGGYREPGGGGGKQGVSEVLRRKLLVMLNDVLST